MRIQLILVFILFSQIAAASDKELHKLFTKYDSIMLRQRVEYIDDVFTKKFLDAHGGKEEFVAMVKELPKDELKSLQPPRFSWKKGSKDELFFATLQPLNSEFKSMENTSHGTRFIIVKEKGKLKIEGTMSDDH